MKGVTFILFVCGLQCVSWRALPQGTDPTDTTWRNISTGDFYKKYSPLNFLHILKDDFKKKNKFNVFTVMPSPANWVTEEHIDGLIKLIYNTDSTHSIMSALSSYLPSDKFSSIGREAQNLIECFRTKKNYPIALNSFGQPDEKKGKELEEWWANYKKRKP